MGTKVPSSRETPHGFENFHTTERNRRALQGYRYNSDGQLRRRGSKSFFGNDSRRYEESSGESHRPPRSRRLRSHWIWDENSVSSIFRRSKSRLELAST